MLSSFFFVSKELMMESVEQLSYKPSWCTLCQLTMDFVVKGQNIKGVQTPCNSSISLTITCWIDGFLANLYFCFCFHMHPFLLLLVQVVNFYAWCFPSEEKIILIPCYLGDTAKGSAFHVGSACKRTDSYRDDLSGCHSEVS